MLVSVDLGHCGTRFWLYVDELVLVIVSRRQLADFPSLSLTQASGVMNLLGHDEYPSLRPRFQAGEGMDEAALRWTGLEYHVVDLGS